MPIIALNRPLSPNASTRPHSSMSGLDRLSAFVFTLLMTVMIPLVGCSEVADDAGGAADPAIAEIDAFIAKNAVDRTSSGWKTKLARPPKLTFDPERTYHWKLETNVGVVQFRLLTDVAPMHASSTIYLTRLGYYDKLDFHRVIKGFMAQGGDPLGNGRGGPGYKYRGEFSPTALHDVPGTLSMANAGPGTDGSQFFITFKGTPQLNNRHTVFGRAESEESLATIRKMESLGRPRDPAPPLEPLFIKKATILIE